LTMCAAVYRSN